MPVLERSFTLLKTLCTGAATVALLTTAAGAQDDARDDLAAEEADVIVVTGSLTPRPASEIGSAISVIDETTLDVTQNIIISDVLRSVPGLAVNRTGPQGALTQVRIRGAEGNQTLVYIDGVEAANPVFGEFNFANLVSADVERIEVIRGPQSALYGSEAIGGVISVITKSPEPGVQGELEAEGGSFSTYRGYAALAAGTETFGLRGTVQYYDTQGVSSAPGGSEEDGFENLTTSVKGVFVPFDGVNIEGIVRYSNAIAETDAQEFSFGTVQDAPNVSESDDLIAKIDVSANLIGEWLKGRAFMAYTDTSFLNYVDGIQTSFSNGDRKDYGIHLTAATRTGPFDHTLTAAFEYEETTFENVNQTRDDTQTSIVGEYNFGFDDALFLSAAIRQDYNNEFEDATTVRIAGAYVLEHWGTRFHGSWGEGVTDPTFNERFGFNPDAFIGNPDLKPERSQGWDIGIEQAFLDNTLIIDLTYFNANLEDEISSSFIFADGQFISTPINNEGESERQGLEVTLQLAFTDDLTFNGQYTYLDATGADGLIEVRRPKHTASANLTLAPVDAKYVLNVGVDYNGEQEDLFFGFADPDFTPRRTLDSYTLVRIAGSYKLTDYLEVFARGENLFDEDYVEVLGFNSTGIAGYAGVRATF